MVLYGMVWYGTVLYCTVWYGMVWYGMFCYGMVKDLFKDNRYQLSFEVYNRKELLVVSINFHYIGLFIQFREEVNAQNERK